MELLHFLKGNDAMPTEPTDEIDDAESVFSSDGPQATDKRGKAAQAPKGNRKSAPSPNLECME
jgi:hypothetical protein